MNLPVRVTTFTQIMRDGKWRLESLHSEDDHLLMWFSKGQGRITINGATKIYGPNAIVFLPAGTPFSMETKQSLFGQVAIVSELADVEMPNAPIFLRIRDLMLHAEFVSHFEALQRELVKPRYGQDRACLYHAGLLGVWLDRQAQEALPEMTLNAPERLAKRYTDLLETRYASGTSVSAMAQELGVTATHLTRCCRQAGGKSAHDMLAERLMYEARDLLLRTDLPVKRIANDLGYRSAAYFTRAFQNNIGTTPSEFRKVG